MVRNYRQIASKALKNKVMEQHPLLRPYLPRTSWFSKEALDYWASRYPLLFIKPDKGGGGAGIIRIRRVNGKWELAFRRSVRIVSKQDLYPTVEKLLLPYRNYLVQEGIHLASVQGRPFDIRIMMQKPKGRWIVSGMVAKVAAHGRFVTNHCKGGRPFRLERILHMMESEGSPAPQGLVQELEKVSLLTANVLESRFPGIKELGIDVALDQRGKIWILEVNTRPHFQMFRKIGKPILYQNILKFHRQLRR
ncbi:YheC/YheD family protein [Melghirimyces algeriensis]|uniref:YheC/D like ATP-grasp n=1 Tax=Melghirimyces algeriensis TaxID=910412 RepID=A0A521DBP0_9BACL|nr:YheC/YheD family protein [Melghirimyces algeriensis]SMO68340.1 YheC/D like ATP-grasp [Melghirimyces algeriensis]